MEARDKFALQKQVRQDLEKLNDPGATARDKFALQKEIRANLEKLGKGIKADNPDVETPLFDRLVAGDFDMNNLEALQKFLTDVYEELKAAGNGESEAIAKMKPPLKEQILKSDVIQEMVGTDLPPEKFKEFTDGLEALIDGLGNEETIEENIVLPFRPPVPKQIPSLADKGIFFLNTDISDDSVIPIIQEIVKQNALPAKERLDNIKIVVSSNGGSVEAAFALIDIMKTSKIPVHTIAMGKVKSAGLLIAMSGTPGQRSIFPNTSVMSHQFSWGMQGKESAMRATAVEVENLSNKLKSHYKECTGLSDARIRKELLPETDRWLTAKQAIEYNLFDKIESGEFYHAKEEELEDQEPEEKAPEGKEEKPVQEEVNKKGDDESEDDSDDEESEDEEEEDAEDCDEDDESDDEQEDE